MMNMIHDHSIPLQSHSHTPSAHNEIGIDVDMQSNSLHSITDYCNAVMHGAPAGTIQIKQQWVHNDAVVAAWNGLLMFTRQATLSAGPTVNSEFSWQTRLHC